MQPPPYLDPARGRLGLAPLDIARWLVRDRAFAAQMAERDRLVAAIPDRVILASPGSEAVQAEALDMVLDALSADGAYRMEAGGVRRPDGVLVPVDRLPPMASIARLIQQDLCLLERQGAAHILTAAALCFPSRWVLAEKAGHPLLAIHAPVPGYAERLGARVQRIFDGLQADRPVERFNGVLVETPGLYQPVPPAHRSGAWLRIERQTLRRLPRTGAVAFGIHTSVEPVNALAPALCRHLLDAHRRQPPAMIDYHGGRAVHARLGAALERRLTPPEPC